MCCTSFLRKARRETAVSDNVIQHRSTAEYALEFALLLLERLGLGRLALIKQPLPDLLLQVTDRLPLALDRRGKEGGALARLARDEVADPVDVRLEDVARLLARELARQGGLGVSETGRTPRSKSVSV